MSSIYIPSFSEISAVAQSRGADSQAPGLWRGLVGAWPLQEPGGLTAFDVSGYRNNGTLTSMDAATCHVVTPMGRALDFDGSDDTINCGQACSFERTDSFSVVAFYKCTSTSPTTLQGLVTKKRDVSLWEGWTLQMRGDLANDPWAFALTNNGDTGNQIGVTFSRPNDTAWHCVAAAYNGTSSVTGMTAWIDGKKQSSPTHYSGPLSATILTTIPFYIGSRNAANPFAGQIGPVQVWNRVLTPSEIRSLYTDPWGMYRLRRRVQVRGAAGGGGTLAADAGAFVESGKAVSLLSSRVATAGVGTFVESGTASGLLASRKVAAGVGSYIESGTAAGLLASHVVAAALGTYTHAGTSAGLLSSRRVAAGVGSYALAGTAALPLASWLVAAGVGAYLLDGKSASLDYSAVVSKAHIAYVNMRRNLA